MAQTRFDCNICILMIVVFVLKASGVRFTLLDSPLRGTPRLHLVNNGRGSQRVVPQIHIQLFAERESSLNVQKFDLKHHFTHGNNGTLLCYISALQANLVSILQRDYVWLVVQSEGPKGKN